MAWLEIICVIMTLNVVNNVGYSQCELLTDDFILVACPSLRSVIQFDLSNWSQTFNITSNSTTKPTAVTFDPYNKTIYWTDSEIDAVFEYNMFSRHAKVFYSDKSVESEYNGMAIDAHNRKLYVTDERNGVILELPLDVHDVRPRVVFSDNQSRPRSIVVDAVNGMLYWTDWREQSEAINRMPINGDRNYTSIVMSTHVQRQMKPNALAINFAGKRIYYSDDNKSLIEELNLNENRRVVPADLNKLGITTCSGLAATTSFVYMAVSGPSTQMIGLYVFESLGGFRYKQTAKIPLHATPAGIYVYNSTEETVHNALPLPENPTVGYCCGNESTSTHRSLLVSVGHADGSLPITFVYIFTGGAVLAVVWFICLTTYCIRRSKSVGITQPVDIPCDIKSVQVRPTRYSQILMSLLAKPPEPPPRRPIPQSDDGDTYLEPIPEWSVDATQDDNSDAYYQDAIGAPAKTNKNLQVDYGVEPPDAYYQEVTADPDTNEYLQTDRGVRASDVYRLQNAIGSPRDSHMYLQLDRNVRASDIYYQDAIG